MHFEQETSTPDDNVTEQLSTPSQSEVQTPPPIRENDLRFGLNRIHTLLHQNDADQALNLLAGIQEGLGNSDRNPYQLEQLYGEQINSAARSIYDTLMRGEDRSLAEAFYDQNEQYLGNSLNPAEIVNKRERIRLRQDGDNYREKRYEEAERLDPINSLNNLANQPGKASEVLELCRKYPHLFEEDLKSKETDSALAKAATYLFSEGVDWTPLTVNYSLPESIMRELNRKGEQEAVRQQGAQQRYEDELIAAAKSVYERQGFAIASEALALWNGSPEKFALLDKVARALYESAEYPAAIRILATINSPDTEQLAQQAIEAVRAEATGQKSKASRINFIRRWLNLRNSAKENFQ